MPCKKRRGGDGRSQMAYGGETVRGSEREGVSNALLITVVVQSRERERGMVGAVCSADKVSDLQQWWWWGFNSIVWLGTYA